MSRGPAARVGIVLGALALVLALWAWLGRDPTTPTRHAAQSELQGSTVAPASSPAPAGDPWALLAAAERAAASSAPALPKVKGSMSEADWQAFDRQWCAAMAPLREAIQAGTMLDGDALVLWLPPESELRAIDKQLAERVGRALAVRADPRERAAGLWWDGKVAELLAMAQATRDPMVAALAAQSMPSPVASLLWHELEPLNLTALLAAQRFLELPDDELLDRIAQTRRQDNWMKEVFKAVYRVPPPTQGAFSEMGVQVKAVGLYSAASMGDVSALTKACSANAAPTRIQRCAKAAEAIWGAQPSDPTWAGVALRLVRHHKTLRPAWADRASELEAVYGWERQFNERSILETTRRTACLASPTWDAITQARLVENEWAFVKSRMPSDMAGVAALAAANRAHNGGRSLLDPAPTATPKP